MADSKNKKRSGPKMVLRFFDPRDDRVGGNEDDFEDENEQNSSSVNRASHRSKSK
jgi:hypothetical protein